MFSVGTPPAGVSLPCTAVTFFPPFMSVPPRPPTPGRAETVSAPLSWDLKLTDARDGSAFGHVERQQPERVVFAVGLDRPPDLVPAGAARGQGRPVAQRAVVSFERGERHAALVRLVAVVQQVTGHEPTVPPHPPPRHRGITLSPTLIFVCPSGPDLVRTRAHRSGIRLLRLAPIRDQAERELRNSDITSTGAPGRASPAQPASSP